jgi:hypothetical protein
MSGQIMANIQYVEKLTWEQARVDLMRVNPEIVKIIDAIGPGSEYSLYKMRYPYGQEIIKGSKFHMPDEDGQLLPIDDPKLKAYYHDLSYNYMANPVSIILNGSAELFFSSMGRTTLMGLVPKGLIFGTTMLLDGATCHHPLFLWSMAAGARSLFMLPKISDAVGFNYLKRHFHLSANKPENLLDHWDVFRQIANSKSIDKPWLMEVIFFGRKWFDTMRDPAWISFHRYLLDNAWQRTGFFRNQVYWDLIFSLVDSKASAKIPAYISRTVQHLIYLGAGALPGYAPAVNDDDAPISLIQQAYLEIYRLKNYYPIIMQPTALARDPQARPIYYSLQFPSALEFIQKSTVGSSTISDLADVQLILERYIKLLNDMPLNLGNTPVTDMLKVVKFDFFHSDVESYPTIRPAAEIPVEDTSFTKIKVPHPDNNVFPENSGFVRGCVRLSRKG